MTKHCRRCDHDWEARVDSPRRCPNCNSPRWMVDRNAPTQPTPVSAPGRGTVKEDRYVKYD